MREVHLALCQSGCRAVQKRCAIPQAAGAQGFHASGSDGFRCGVTVKHGCLGKERGQGITKISPQSEGDLADVRHLFQRGSNERGEAFPEWLPQDAQAGSVGHGLSQRGIISGESPQDGGEIMIQGEVGNDLGSHGGGCYVETIRCLHQVNGIIPNGAEPAFAKFMPVEDLTRIDGGAEIEGVGEGNEHGAS